MAKPYSPESLADRWGCSAEKVRRMYHGGEIDGFRLGKLIRIPADAVERYECQNTGSLSTEESSASPTMSPDEAAFVSRLARMTGGSRNLALATSGGREPAQQPTG